MYVRTSFRCAKSCKIGGEGRGKGVFLSFLQIWERIYAKIKEKHKRVTGA